MCSGCGPFSPPPATDRIASRSRSSLCGRSLMVMTAMRTSVHSVRLLRSQPTMAIGTLKRQAYAQANGTGSSESRRRRGAPRDARVAGTPTDPARCCLTPTTHEPPAMAAGAHGTRHLCLFFKYLWNLGTTLRQRWHGARTVDPRVDAQNF